MKRYWFTISCAGLSLLALSTPAQAEPYLAVRSGQQCAACHVNPTGGGKRTEYGTLYGNNALPAGKLDGVLDRAVSAWDGRITDYFAVGADLRTGLQSTSVPNSEDEVAFGSDRTTVYLDLRIIPNRLSVYVDERVAPGNAFNRESYLLLRSEQQTAYLKAGRFFLPYGLRLEDDSAFIRQVSGVNFNSSDDGVEGGWTLGPWSLHLAGTNGAAGGAETNTGKQVSLLTDLVYSAWRIGASLNTNNNDNADRDMGNVFAGLRTGIVSWLGEVDYFVDDGTPTGRRKSYAGLLEANTEVARGHNLKLTYEYYDPDREVDEDQRTRYSLVWEYTPFQALQLRGGYRQNEGIPQNDQQNAKELFVQLHAYL
jgi:hypothetical protein